ncbi:MAG TPA: helix-turn-helix domain-containing protein [Herpetosiphonaceae bacterium]
MNHPPHDRIERLHAALVRLLLRQGYDKTTMQEVAEEAGISRGMLYLAYASKDQLLAAVLADEVRAYVTAWQTFLARDDTSGSLGSLYRAVLAALTERPLLLALLKQDRRTLGRYVQQAESGLPALAAQSLWPTTLRELQAVGALRPDVNPTAIAQLLDVISAGMMALPPSADGPALATLLDTIATVLDRALLPDDGGDAAAGQAVLRALGTRIAAQFAINSSATEVQP